MLKAAELSALTQPLIERATLAERSRDFRDRAARFVLERLGVAALTTLDQAPDADASEVIAAIQWIDTRAGRFFHHHPEGQGIEIDVGLSTRFHRLSEASDWPRFTWQMVSRPDVDDCLKFVFPRLDNFRTIASESPLDSLAVHALWRGAVATMIVLGEDHRLEEEIQLRHLCRVAQELKTAGIPEIQWVVQHRFESLGRALAAIAPRARVVDEQQPDIRRGLCHRDWLGNLWPRSPRVRETRLACIAF